MILFVILAGLILLGALSLVIPPLFRSGPPGPVLRQDLNIQIARERLAELKVERTAGRLSNTGFDQARADLEEALLADLEVPGAAPTQQRPRPYIAIIVAALLPITALTLYLKLGTPDIIVDSNRGTPPADPAQGSRSAESLLLEVKARLAQNPKDSRGWSILAHAMMSLGNYPEAVTAYGKLYELTGDDPDVLVRYADALAMAAGGDLIGRPTDLIQRALQLDPYQAQGLWLAGMAAEARGDLILALEYWYRLAPLLSAEPEPAKELAGLIDRTSRLAVSQGLVLPQRSADDQDPQAVTAGVSLTVIVQATSELAGEIRDSDTLYVYARPASGPAVPVAALRLPASGFPVRVTLDDSAAVMRDKMLSELDTVVVGAHISRTGNARRQSGDLTGESVTTPVDSDGTITLHITTRVP